MSISTFDELKTSVADFLNRDDLTNVIPQFIKLAEARANREIRHWRMEKRATATLDTQFTSLPTDFLEAIRLTLNTPNTKPLEVAGNFEIASILYYSTINPLSSSNTTNWLLTYHPDVMLYGALLHSAPYLGDDGRIAIWGAYYASSIEALNRESESATTGGAGRRMKIRSYG